MTVYMGSSRAVVARLHADGSLDESFGKGGFVLQPRGVDSRIHHEALDGWPVFTGYGDGHAVVGLGTYRLLGENLKSPGIVVLNAPDVFWSDTSATIEFSRELGSDGPLGFDWQLGFDGQQPDSYIVESNAAWKDGEFGARTYGFNLAQYGVAGTKQLHFYFQNESGDFLMAGGYFYPRFENHVPAPVPNATGIVPPVPPAGGGGNFGAALSALLGIVYLAKSVRRQGQRKYPQLKQVPQPVVQHGQHQRRSA
jgi:hypothetical protein